MRRIAGNEVIENTVVAHARWPDGRVDSSRLDGIATVQPSPSYTFDRSDKILAIGSCFARNIERCLTDYGFDLPMMRVEVPREQQNATDGSNMFLNKYTIQSIENELRWAAGEAKPPPEALYVEVEQGLWRDLHLATSLVPAPLNRVVATRATVEDAFRGIADCRIVIITLGLAEAWFDKATGLYLNIAPQLGYLRGNADRFEVEVMSHDAILASLERVRALLARSLAPGFKMLLTVSPVPMKMTFTGTDALMANMYSKSVQRAAAGAFADAHDDVDYFPSYEIVALTDRAIAYERDDVHVSAMVVDAIMRQVLTAYAPSVDLGPAAAVVPAATRTDAPDFREMMGHGFGCRKVGNNVDAIAVFSSMLQRFGDTMPVAAKGDVLDALGGCLLRMGQHDEAIRNLEAAAAITGTTAHGAYRLGSAYQAAKRNDEALVCFEEAVDREPDNANYRYRLGVHLRGLRRVDDAHAAIASAVRIDPQHARAREFLAHFEPATSTGTAA